MLKCNKETHFIQENCNVLLFSVSGIRAKNVQKMVHPCLGIGLDFEVSLLTTAPL